MFELLVGKPLFDGSTEDDIYTAICEVDFEFPKQPAISAAARDLKNGVSPPLISIPPVTLSCQTASGLLVVCKVCSGVKVKVECVHMYIPSALGPLKYLSLVTSVENGPISMCFQGIQRHSV